MAAGLRQMKLHNKRKLNELEDISNIHKSQGRYRLKMKMKPRNP